MQLQSTKDLPPMRVLWDSFKESSSSSSSLEDTCNSSWQLFSSSTKAVSKNVEMTSQSVSWMIENRGGIALLTGALIVPSKFIGHNLEDSDKIINNACNSNNYSSNKFTMEKFSCEFDGYSIRGIIYYPPGCKGNEQRCVLYHNPNGITVAGYFDNGRLSWTPVDIVNLENCPIILYDYRGTGLSKEQTSTMSSSVGFCPTYESVVVDGCEVLKMALKKFSFVTIWGSSLGGGVATASLERHLVKNLENPEDAKRVSLTNHDSFTVTSRVILPNCHITANVVGALVGGNLNAETPMRSLVRRGIKIRVLCHLDDPVIPQGARMAEFIETLPNKDNVSLIYSDRRGHADLSYDMKMKLRET